MEEPGKTLDEFTLSKSNAHVTIGGTVGVATCYLTFGANFENRTLHLGGQACYRDFEWHCSSFDETILRF